MVLEAVTGSIFCLAILISIISMEKLRRVRRHLQDMTDALNEIQAGNGNRRILAADNDLTADLSYKMNEIVYSYEEQLFRLKEADEMNRQLMTSLSHDVRTPLTTLIGYLDAAHRGIVVGKEREDYMEIARRKAYNLKEYIDILFDWFKLNSSEFALSIERAELAELTRNVLKDWIPVLEENHIEYEIEIPEKPLFANVDLDGYSRIINNLMQNVISHSQALKVKITIEIKDNEIVIHIEDNGIGISKTDLEHIFERLYKCDKGRSGKGSGLGLSIVRQLAEKMNGFITVQSQPDQYTVFTIGFPLKN